VSQGHRHSVGRLNQPFVGIPTFLRASLCGDLEKLDADVAIMGVPTDEGSPYLAGSRFGPGPSASSRSASELTGGATTTSRPAGGSWSTR
jgi:arginase family enzyme